MRFCRDPIKRLDIPFWTANTAKPVGIICINVLILFVRKLSTVCTLTWNVNLYRPYSNEFACTTNSGVIEVGLAVISIVLDTSILDNFQSLVWVNVELHENIVRVLKLNKDDR